MNPFGFILAVATVSLGYLAAIDSRRRQQVLRRLGEEAAASPGVMASDAAASGALARWLSVAGYRAPNASRTFWLLTLLSAAAGLVVSQIYHFLLEPGLSEVAANAPGTTAEVLGSILHGGPWMLFLFSCALPALVVRTSRRTRVAAIERDLPLVLELFATMAQAGLGFDAALANVVRSRNGHRALNAEFVSFQLDMLSGVPRVQALRNLAHRVDIPALSRFTSALIQAEQTGASMADTLQHQAEDLRQRRRENALLQAQTLPVKLVFPLVICFLPGIFVSTLAPVIYQMILMANSVLSSGGR
jgi:tight adherence protein C